MLAVALVSIAVAVFYGKAWFEKAQLESARERLVRETVLAGAILDRLGDHTSGLPQLAAILDMPEERLSLLNSKGSVLGDTAPGAQPVTRLDNHADRPEVRAAMAGKPGFTIRPSGTLGTDLAYAAVALQNGDILRVSVPLVSLRQIIDSQLAVFTRIGLITVALSLVLAAPMAVQASEITLVPAVKLQIGDQDNNGHYWDGGRWRDHDWWKAHYDWRDNHWRAHDEHRHDHHDDHDRGRGPDRDWRHH